MTAELLDEALDDAETVVVAWLSPLRRTANTRKSGDPLPYTLVTAVAPTENVDESYGDVVVQVETLCAKSLGWVAARDEADETHRRMLLLARYLEDVELADGRNATIDYVDVFESPRWREYGDDQILRKVGRYRMGLSYVWLQ